MCSLLGDNQIKLVPCGDEIHRKDIKVGKFNLYNLVMPRKGNASEGVPKRKKEGGQRSKRLTMMPDTVCPEVLRFLLRGMEINEKYIEGHRCKPGNGTTWETE